MSNNRTPGGEVYVVGAGIVGSEIAATHLDASYPVHLSDIDEAALQSASRYLRECFPDLAIRTRSLWATGLPTVELRREATAANARGSAPIVIESIPEIRESKRELLSRLEAAGPPDAVLATNTSTLRLSDLASALKEPSRLCGLHFFMPVRRRPLVEVVGGEKTRAAVLEQAERHVRRIERVALRVPDTPGFIVNRILVPILNEATLLLCEGIPAARIESAARQIGFPVGPLEMMDLIGLRTAFDCGRAMWQAFPKRIEPSPILPAMLKRKQQGKRGGSGFYDYPGGVRSQELSATAKKLASDYTRQKSELSELELRDRILIPLLVEVAFILHDSIATTVAEIDLAMQSGLGVERSNGFIQSLSRVRLSDLIERMAEFRTLHRRFESPEWLDAALRRGTDLPGVFSRLASTEGRENQDPRCAF